MPARRQELVDRLEPVPGPGFDALAERVVDTDGDLELLGLVASHVLLELLLGVRHDREILGRNAVSLRAVAVAPEGDAPAASLPGREDDPPGDPGGQVLLEDAPVDHLDGEMRHLQPPAGPRPRANPLLRYGGPTSSFDATGRAPPLSTTFRQQRAGRCP